MLLACAAGMSLRRRKAREGAGEEGGGTEKGGEGDRGLVHGERVEELRALRQDCSLSDRGILREILESQCPIPILHTN